MPIWLQQNRWTDPGNIPYWIKRSQMEIGYGNWERGRAIPFLGTHSLYLLCSAPLPHSHYLSHAAVKLLYFATFKILFCFCSVLVSGWESLRRSLLEAGASRRLMEDIRLAAAALRQNILAVGGPDTPLLDTLDQQDLTTRLHKFRVSQQHFVIFFSL